MKVRVKCSFRSGRALARLASFALLTTAFAFGSTFTLAQPQHGRTTRPSAKPTSKKPKGDAGPGAGDTDAAVEPMSGRPENTPPPRNGGGSGSQREAGDVVESKTLDGGAKVFRFGEVEIEGRLRSPQLVYFLRRVRAEFAAGDLGHRSFIRELSNTRQSASF